jgi:hypothetical protein
MIVEKNEDNSPLKEIEELKEIKEKQTILDDKIENKIEMI